MKFPFLLLAFACLASAEAQDTGKGRKDRERKADDRRKDEKRLQLPKGFFVLENLEEAQSKAATEEKPVTFLITAEGTGDEWTIDATEKFIDEVKNTVIVYVKFQDANDRAVKMPEAVKAALAKLREDRGSIPQIPIVVITDAAVSKALTSVASNRFYDGRTQKPKLSKALEYLRQEIQKIE
ncbi:hypothetical protein [Luteolibacter sp. Populi]|uniref:hypothetical protein n=1 Tax=Luteolibacter sp. Populi TaxID=3230487 RepID=UPI003467C7F8